MGPSGVGKTTLMYKYCKSDQIVQQTIGVDFQIKYIQKYFPKAKDPSKVSIEMCIKKVSLGFQNFDMGYGWRRKISVDNLELYSSTTCNTFGI